MKKASKKKADILAREIGCIVCRVFYGHEGVWADIHHPAPGRKRISDDVFFPLCKYHHVGHPVNGVDVKQTAQMIGPSLALNKRDFIEAFGTELELYEMSEQLYRKWNESRAL